MINFMLLLVLVRLLRNARFCLLHKDETFGRVEIKSSSHPFIRWFIDSFIHPTANFREFLHLGLCENHSWKAEFGMKSKLLIIF